MKALPYIPFICFFLVFYAILWPVGLLSGSDDTAHFEALENMGGLGWVMWRAETWAPRLFSDFFYAALIFRLEIWKLINAIIGALLLFGIWRISLGPKYSLNQEENLNKNLTTNRALPLASLAICLLFFFIYPNAITSSSIWFTGSFNYLWPVTALLFGLMPFIFFLRGDDPYPKKIWIPIGIIASICAGFTEQTTAVSIGVSLLILIYCMYKKQKMPKWLIIHFVVIAICAVYYMYSLLMSPRVGGGSEIALLPEFADFGFADKLILGIHVFDAHLLRSSNLLFLTLALLAGFLACRKLKEKHIIKKILLFFPAFYIFLNVIPFRYIMSGFFQYPEHYAGVIGMPAALDHDPAEWFNFIFNVPPMSGEYSPPHIFIAFLGLVVVLFMVYPLVSAFREKTTRFLALVLYLASFASGIIMGFSPTVFASGSRPFFLANIFMLLLCTMLIKEGMTSDDVKISDTFLAKTKVSKVFLAIALLIVVYMILMYIFVYSSGSYWWY